MVTNLPTPGEKIDPKHLAEFKRIRRKLSSRRRVLRGAKEYLGEQAGKELLEELESVERQYQAIDRVVKENEFFTVEENPQQGMSILFSRDGYKLGIPDNVNRVSFDYHPLEEAGLLTIAYQGDIPSLYDFSVFNIELTRLINNVALALLSEHAPGRLEQLRYTLGDILSSRGQSIPIVDIQIGSIRIGSFEEVISVAVISFLTQPDVRAILTNLVSNVIWALGAKLGPVIRGDLQRPAVSVPEIEIGENLRDVLVKYIPQDKGSVNIELVEERPNEGRRHITIQVNNQVAALTTTTPVALPQLTSGDGD